MLLGMATDTYKICSAYIDMAFHFRCANLRENVVVYEKCTIGEGTTISNTVIGRNCKIERNCVLENAYIFDGVEIAENCVIRFAVIGKDAKLRKGCVIENGSVIGSNVIVPEKSSLSKQLVTAAEDDEDNGRQFKMSLIILQNTWNIVFYLSVALSDYEYRKLGSNAFVLEPNISINTHSKDAVDSDEEEDLVPLENSYMSNLNYKYESSIYSSSSDDAESDRQSPVPEDGNSELHNTFSFFYHLCFYTTYICSIPD